MSLSTTVFASNSDKAYISDLKFVIQNEGHTEISEAIANGYIEIKSGMLSVLYLTTDNAGEAITGILFSTDTAEETKTLSGIQYIFSAGYINGDGETINVYLTKSKAAGTPITTVSVDTTKNPDNWYTLCRGETTDAAVLGVTADGENIYLHYRRKAEQAASAFSGGKLTVIIIGASAVVAFSIIAAVMKARNADKKNTVHTET